MENKLMFAEGLFEGSSSLKKIMDNLSNNLIMKSSGFEGKLEILDEVDLEVIDSIKNNIKNYDVIHVVNGDYLLNKETPISMSSYILVCNDPVLAEDDLETFKKYGLVNALVLNHSDESKNFGGIMVKVNSLSGGLRRLS